MGCRQRRRAQGAELLATALLGADETANRCDKHAGPVVFSSIERYLARRSCPSRRSLNSRSVQMVVTWLVAPARLAGGSGGAHLDRRVVSGPRELHAPPCPKCPSIEPPGGHESRGIDVDQRGFSIWRLWL